MKKFISILLLISSIVSYYIVYGNEQNNFTKNMDEIEMNLANSYQLMIPVNIDKKDKNQSYKDIVKILDRYEGSIYYDRMSKDESTRVKYIYDIFNMYTSNINIIDGKQITSELMESNKYLSTRKITDDLQIGRIATFNKNVNFEIRTLKSMLDENYSFTGPCYVSFKSNIDINAFINELEKELDTKGIVTINKVPINIIQENNYQIIIIIIYFIVMLLLLYELLNSYKKIGIKKMLGYSIKDIYLENILQLIKINLSVGLIVILSMSFIFFNQLNIYVYTFIFKFIFYTLINTLFLAIVCSIVYIYSIY